MDFETHVKQTVIALLVVAIATTGTYAGSLVGQLFTKPAPTQLITTEDGDEKNTSNSGNDVSKNSENRKAKKQKNTTKQSNGIQKNTSPELLHLSPIDKRIAPYCGDGIQQASTGEDCDLGDQNGENNSGCDVACKKAPVCGNGSIERHEECDEGKANGKGFCTAKCKKRELLRESASSREEGKDHQNGQRQAETVSSMPLPQIQASCGDGKVQKGLGEQCDDGNTTNGDGCNIFCLFEQPNSDSDAKEDKRHSSSAESQLSVDEKDQKSSSAALPDVHTTGTFISSEASVKEANLGCLAPTGNWTHDRKKCAKNQRDVLEHQNTEIKVEVDVEDGKGEGEKKVVKVKKEIRVLRIPPETLEPEEIVQQKIAVRILGINRVEEKRQQLLGSVQEAKKRLEILKNSPLSEEVQNYITRSIAWFEQSESYFNDSTRSLEEMKLMVDPMKEVLRKATNLVKQEQDPGAELIRIHPILTRTEKLLLQFRQSFVALIDAGVKVDKSAINAYINAASTFVEVKAQCLTSKNTCNRLSDVLDQLQIAQVPLQKLLEKYPDVLNAVETKL